VSELSQLAISKTFSGKALKTNNGFMPQTDNSISEPTPDNALNSSDVLNRTAKIGSGHGPT
jgi:hypothetical protein